MITNSDVENLVQLARIELSEKEVEKLTKEVDSILGYVSQVQKVGADLKPEVSDLKNVMREDIQTNEPGQYTESILKNAPMREGNYLKVKKVL